jgi:hypothetical protein
MHAVYSQSTSSNPLLFCVELTRSHTSYRIESRACTPTLFRPAHAEPTSPHIPHRMTIPRTHPAWTNNLRYTTSVPSVVFDAVDPLINVRGVGWSWPSQPFPRDSILPPSITIVLFKLLMKLTVFDASHYAIQHLHPPTNDPNRGSIFDPSLPFVPRAALAAFCSVCCGVCAYAVINFTYHCVTLVGRIVFRQPASAWPHLSLPPTVAASLPPTVAASLPPTVAASLPPTVAASLPPTVAVKLASRVVLGCPLRLCVMRFVSLCLQARDSHGGYVVVLLWFRLFRVQSMLKLM